MRVLVSAVPRTGAKALTQVAPAIAGHLRCQLLLPLKLQRPDIPMMSNSILVSTGKTNSRPIRVCVCVSAESCQFP
jgi:hypothetical protein